MNDFKTKATNSIGLDDFLGSEKRIKTTSSINLKTKISDFANIKISAIDERGIARISKHIKSIRKNLNLLKSLLEKRF
jgi:hypothetical protein